LWGARSIPPGRQPAIWPASEAAEREPMDRPDRGTTTLPIETVRRGERRPVQDAVAVEEPLEIRLVHEVDGAPVTTSVSITMRTPGHDFELAVGFLYTEGIIHGRDAIERVSYCVDGFVEQQYNVVNVYLSPGAAFDASRLARNFYVSSSCGV